MKTQLTRVAAIQMTSTPDKFKNLIEAKKRLDEAVSKGANLVCFPENFSLMAANSKDTIEGAEDLNGMTAESLCEWAVEQDVWIHSGSFPIRKKNKKITNTSLVISPDGEIVARYDKIHLFSAQIEGDRTYSEDQTYDPGNKIVSVDTPLGNLGLSICYDIRFPELYRKLANKGAEILFIPVAFTVPTGKAHWDVLTRARAIENQCYVVCSAQYGDHYPGRSTYGYTRIINPWGEIIAERPKGPGVIIADLNLKEMKTTRKKLPALSHRKIKQV